MKRFPIVLDFDASVAALPYELRIQLANWQESLRYGCSQSWLDQFARLLDQRLPVRHGTVFTGSGDYHHLSLPLIARQRDAGPLRVVVLDGRPDLARFPFGVHCGSWLCDLARLPHVAHVYVVGAAARSLACGQAWKRCLRPLRAGRLSCWGIGAEPGWPRWLGMRDAIRTFPDAAGLTDAIEAALARTRGPSYLSIDKAVFAAPDRDAATAFQECHANSVIDALGDGLVGSDITGEVSRYRYQSGWKRLLNAREQAPVRTGSGAQAAHGAPGDPEDRLAMRHALNRRLAERLGN